MSARLAAPAIAAFMAAATAGCVVTPSETPAAAFTVPGGHLAVGECSFALLVRNHPDVRMVHLESQDTVRVFFADKGVYGWEADFRPAGAQTAIEIRTIAIGRQTIVNRLRKAIDECSG